MLHAHHAFYEDAPQFIDQFKQKWLNRFPRTFDTKYMAESNEVLGGLQPPATLRSLCDFMLGHHKDLAVDISPITPEFAYSLPGKEEEDLSHDAGYDAMMTSLVFLAQIKHIIERRSIEFGQIEFGSSVKAGEQKIPIHELLRNACNKIRMVKTQPASLNLKERE
jgi:poly(A)-specific ribonuclease